MQKSPDFTLEVDRYEATLLLRVLEEAEYQQSTQPPSDYGTFVETAAQRLRDALRGAE